VGATLDRILDIFPLSTKEAYMAVPKVLVIDDEPALQKAIQKILKNENYNLAFANNGLEGLAYLKGEKPDLIFLDLRMPGLDGFGFLERINIKPDDPYHVVVITGALNSG
jgi:CheY-like chemotaxis protein